MTAKKLYRVRLAREVRQEAEVEMWADSADDAERKALTLPSQANPVRAWISGDMTEPWIVSIEESA